MDEVGTTSNMDVKEKEKKTLKTYVYSKYRTKKTQI